MDQVCAVVDTQGFWLHSVYLPAEICGSSPTSHVRLRVKPYKKFEKIQVKDQHTAMFLERNHHGLSFDTDEGYYLHDAMERIRAWCLWQQTPSRKLIGVKSDVASDLLTDMGIEVINLTRYGATWKNLYKDMVKMRPCNYHQDIGKLIHCSNTITKALRLWLVRKNT